MPKLKRPAGKYDRLIVCITGHMALTDVTVEALARAMGCSRNTVNSRLREPQSITLGELGKISRCLGIPIEEIRSCVVN